VVFAFFERILETQIFRSQIYKIKGGCVFLYSILLHPSHLQSD